MLTARHVIGGGVVLKAPENDVLQSPTTIGTQHLTVFRRDGYVLQSSASSQSHSQSWQSNIFHRDGVCLLYIIGDSMVRGIGSYTYPNVYRKASVSGVHEQLYAVAPYSVTATYPGKTIEQVFRLLPSELGVHPARAPTFVLFVGTNDALNKWFDFESSKGSYRKLMKLILSYCRDCRVVCTSLLPCFFDNLKSTRNGMYKERIDCNVRLINGFILNLVEEFGSKVSYLDLGSHFRRGGPKFLKGYLSDDRLHLNQAGYNYVNRLLAKHLVGTAPFGL